MNRTQKFYTVKRLTMGVAFSLWSALFLAVQSEAATNEFPGKTIAGEMKFQVQVKCLKYLGEEVVFEGGPTKVTVSPTKAGREKGFGVWAMECEVKIETTKGGVVAAFDQAFNSKWFDLS